MDKYLSKYVKTMILSGLMTICCIILLVVGILTSDSGFVFEKHAFTLVIALSLFIWFLFELSKVLHIKKAFQNLVQTEANYIGYVSKTFGIYRPFRVFALTVEIKEENGETFQMTTGYEYRENQIKDLVIGANIPVSYNKKIKLLIINKAFESPDKTVE